MLPTFLMTNPFPSDSIWGHLSLTHFSRGSSCLSTVNWGQTQPGHGARSSQRWTQSWQHRTSPVSPSHRWLALKERSSRVMRWAVTSEHPNTSIHHACAHLALIPSLPFPWRGECVKEQSNRWGLAQASKRGRCWVAGWTQWCKLRGGCSPMTIAGGRGNFMPFLFAFPKQ